ncbi:hypothetical protein [Saccharopolyspora elongata]|uniref:Uncharacterized protein n=1 Tax=Saccharopolyspora elongata TaxID=2530387 RepID=A0A4R4YRA8_9PSEU|nr:hypothetical protein [Saccharopolyspora elongata]TDD47726.1 hypothetical protein E1288_23995 [Saccharopolyspora elongata]
MSEISEIAVVNGIPGLREGEKWSDAWWTGNMSGGLPYPVLNAVSRALNTSVDVRSWMGKYYGKGDITIILDFPWREENPDFIVPDGALGRDEYGYSCNVHVPPEMAAESDPGTVFAWLYSKGLEALEHIGKKTRLGRPLYGAHMDLPLEFAPESGAVRLVALPRLVKKIANLDDEQKAVLVPVDKMRGADAWAVDLGAVSAVVPRSVRGRAEFVEPRVRASGVLPKEQGTWGHFRINSEGLSYRSVVKDLKLLERWAIYQLSCEVVDVGRVNHVYWMTIAPSREPRPRKNVSSELSRSQDV